MTFPRRVLPGQTYLVTRRCARRCFLLKPVPRLKQIFNYCLGLALDRFSIELHALIVLSNHCHFVLTDTRGDLPRFMHLLDCLSARALNAHWGRGENFWAPGSYSAVELYGEEAILDKLVYTITNAVKGGLVSHPEKWPGLHSTPKDIGRRVLRVSRPDFFFRRKSDLPESVKISFSQPRVFSSGPESFRRRLQSLVDDRLAKLRQSRRDGGKRRFLGKREIMAQHPFDSPGGTFPTRRLNPRISCKDKKRRILLLGGLHSWRGHYSEAWGRFGQGEREVHFPAGTYWMRVAYQVHCGPAPPLAA